jgi:dTDP-4-dehydrorhamnose 3,5-epimerase
VVQIRQLTIPDAFEVTPQIIRDTRGAFLEWYRFDELEAVLGHRFELRQGNTSVSRRGVVRGIHFADVPPGQAKYVTVPHGAVIDFVVDVRAGSPTFGKWDSVLLDDVDRRGVYLAEGLGHALVALTESATVSYLVSDTYHPGAEHGVNPLDPEIGIVYPDDIGPLIFSEKDEQAPTLREALDAGTLPSWQVVTDHYRSLNDKRA